MDPLSLLGRAVAVFLLLGITLWLLRRTDGLKKLRRSETPLEVLGSARLGKGASVALVRIGDADYALGVTDQAVSLLTEAELAEEPEPAEADEPKPARPGFPAALQAQLGLLTRRGHGSRLDRPDGAQPAAAPLVPRADAPTPEPASFAGGADDSDFALLLAAATAPVERDAEPAGERDVEPAARTAARSRSAQLKQVVEPAEAAVDVSPTRTSATARASARSTGARGARGPRARAAAGDALAQAGAARTGQRRSARTRSDRPDSSAAA
jgi:flagellar biogenesis protein FliO